MQRNLQRLSAVFLALLTVHARAAVLYVDSASENPTPPYAGWSTAATTIQDAVDAAAPGDAVIVTNGVYQTGGRVVSGLILNRVAVTNAITVRSVNGPAATVIAGYAVPGITNGAGAVRCVYLADGSALAGFTLTNGATQNGGDLATQQSGGGVWCNSASAIISNCVLVGNSADKYGGGAYYGTLIGCTLAGNTALEGGGSFQANLTNCSLTGNSASRSAGGAFGGALESCSLNGNSASSVVGGAAEGATLNRCTVISNTASSGAGVFDCTLTNCLVRNNVAATYGGGGYCSVLYNCTVTGNSAATNYGGTLGCPLYNCIVYYNTTAGGSVSNYATGDPLSYCCTTPLPLTGLGNFTNAPRFVNLAGADLHLQATSPGINAGLNAYAPDPLDLDGNPRIRAGTVDLGAYEFQAEADSRPFAWGSNAYGELGDNTMTGRPIPVAVNTTAGLSALSGRIVVALAAGAWHSTALCADGTVVTWGSDGWGQLGINGTVSLAAQSRVPVAVDTSAGVSALAGKAVVAIAAGWGHNLALCADGTVASWGRNDAGQLGNNTDRIAGTMSVVPVPVNTDAGVSALAGKIVVAIAAGYAHSLALCSDGTVAAWGANNAGQLGDNTMTNRVVPVAVNSDSGVSALNGRTVAAIAGGGDFSLALCTDGTVVGWGANGAGQLGDNTTTNRLVPVTVNTDSGLSALYSKRVVALAAGDAHSLALCSDGTVAAWGDNYNGQLGDTGASGPQSHVPVLVSTAAGVSALAGKAVMAIAAGYEHSLALCSDGTAAGWGLNHYAQVGDGTASDRFAPTAVSVTPLAVGQRFSVVASGPASVHSLAVVSAPPVAAVTMTRVCMMTNRSCRFSFTNTPGAFFEVLAASNAALPLADWVGLTGLVEVSPGQFQFSDSPATSTPSRYYRVRSP